MSQSQRGSIREAWFNTLIGFGINYCANLLIFPLFGMHISPANNLLLGVLYTLISVARSYCVRRTCNRMRESWFR